MLGRLLAFFDFLRGSPQVILDPTGGTIDNFLDRMILLAPEVQAQLWPYIRYVDLGAIDFISTTQLYRRRHASDTLFTIANRPLEVFRRLDPHLQTASVEGWNALFETGIYAGQVTAALGLQVTDLADMLRRPKRWLPRFDTALQRYPELQPAVDFLREYAKLKPDLQRRRSGSLLTKLLPFLADPTMTAMFAGVQDRIDIGAVDQGCLTLLVDGRNEHDPVRRQFKLLWVLRLVTDYLKERGMAGRERPLALIIDEVTQLLGFHNLENTAMAEDLEELISVLARNYGCNATIAHQSLTQIASERIRNVLMQMGTQVIGRIHNPEDQIYLARHFFRYEPYKVKKYEPIWMSIQQGMGPLSYSIPEVIDYRSQEWTADEQVIELSNRFRDLDRFCFLVRQATGEGMVGDYLKTISIESIDANRYPDQVQLTIARSQLRERDGVPLADLLRTIPARRNQPVTAQQPPQQEVEGQEEEHAILDPSQEESHAATSHHDLPSSHAAAKAAVPAGAAQKKPDPKPDPWKESLWEKR